MSGLAEKEPGKSILIVDDDRAIREALGELLAGEGYAVRLATNGQDGLDQLKRDPFLHLILLDLMMPVKDGLQFRTEQMGLPQVSRIPVVVMTAYHESVKVNRVGALRILHKPLELAEVLSTVRDALGS